MLLAVGKGLQSAIDLLLMVRQHSLTRWPFSSFVVLLAVGFESQKQLNDKQRPGSEICDLSNST